MGRLGATRDGMGGVVAPGALRPFMTGRAGVAAVGAAEI